MSRVSVSELQQDAFLVKVARSEEKQWHGLTGREMTLFFAAVSKQWRASQENAAATVIPLAEAKVIWRTLKETRLSDRVMPSWFVLVERNEGKSTAENPLDVNASARIVVLGYADPEVWKFGEILQALVAKQLMSN